MSKSLLQERTTEPEVFQDMDNFDLLNDSSTFALSLRLQFPKFAKGFTSSDFEPFVKSHVGEDNLVSLGRLCFPNEWQMQVKCKEVRESLIRLGKIKINTRTCWITPLSQSEVRGFIHWIPTAVQNKKLETLLRSYGEVLLLENQKQKKWTLNVQSDARYFALYLKSGKTADDVPHFIKVSGYYGLITIRGRNPACFHCRELGHRKTECKFFREKISDYSMRPPGTGKPRIKPRGKRHVPGKQAVPKAVDQAVQTDDVELEDTELISSAEAGSLDASGSEAKCQEVSPSSATQPDAQSPSQIIKTKAEIDAEKFEQLLKDACERPALNLSELLKEKVAICDNKKESIPCQDETAPDVNTEKESVPKKEESVGLNQLDNNFGVILESKDVLGVKEKDVLGLRDEKPAEGKKKRKKRKNKKKDVGVNTG
ncbi:hypothetical protein JTE90_024570 [Oedothorax gibbosus]|uniref:CCHC-type domain-containing protein n=1 Tax=Oedothorax gibbosus TaxID=931172 RepID=A0AAV6VC83_9ARAC|nr:hypothetical protein JTE90_024570 [Oedothorax gibbosus]